MVPVFINPGSLFISKVSNMEPAIKNGKIQDIKLQLNESFDFRSSDLTIADIGSRNATIKVSIQHLISIPGENIKPIMYETHISLQEGIDERNELNLRKTYEQSIRGIIKDNNLPVDSIHVRSNIHNCLVIEIPDASSVVSDISEPVPVLDPEEEAILLLKPEGPRGSQIDPGEL